MKKKYFNKQFLIYLFLFLICTVVFVWNNSYSSIWFDEACTIQFTRFSFSDIIDITSADVHPPLFYFMLKIYCYIFGYNTIVIRFFPLIPILILVLLASTKGRKIFGDKIMINFILLLILMPVMLYVVSEIRMYSWCMLWVCLSALYAYQLYHKINVLNAVLYVLFSLSAAYTHYYGLLSIFFLYIVLFVSFLIYQRKRISLILALGIIIAICYIPWLSVFFRQISLVKSGFWIPLLKWNQVIDYVYSPFEFSYPELNISTWFISLMSILIFLLVCSCFVILIKVQFKKNSKMIRIANIALLLYLLPGIVGIIISIFIKPIFISRYLICGFSLFIFAFAIYLSQLNFKDVCDKIIIVLFSVLLITISVINFSYNRLWAKERDSIQVGFSNYIKDKAKDAKTAVLYEETSASLAVFSTLFPDVTHYALVDTTQVRNLNIVRSLSYTPVFSLNDIDTTFTTIICIESYGLKDNILRKESIAEDILKDFKIKNKISVGNMEYNLYELERIH